jgi:hypothetical protein
MEDPKSWRKALARAIDSYGTTITSKKDGESTATPKTDDGGKINPDIAKDATPEQLGQLNELKGRIKKVLAEVVGPPIDERKKKHAPSSDELQEMKQALHNLGDARRRAGNRIRTNAIQNIVSKYGIRAIEPLSEAIDGQNIVEDKGMATAIGQIVGAGEKDDAQALVRAYGIPEKLLALLEFTGDAKAASVRIEGNKALEAIAGQGMGWPADVQTQEMTREENEARARWADWVKQDAQDFVRTEKQRDDHRKALNELLKKLDSPRGWRDALEAAPAAISKAERDLKKG